MNIELKDTDKEYYIIVNRYDIKNKAESLGYDNTIMIAGDIFDDEALSALNASGKAVVLAFDWTSESGNYENVVKRLKEKDIKYLVLTTLDEDGAYYKVGDDGFSVEKLIDEFPDIDKLESRLIHRRLIHSTDYKNRCGNCHAYLRDDYKYCEQCGTERGKGAFLPYNNIINCVYGPPIKTKFKCSACGYIWIDGALGGHEAHYCPRCGKKTVDLIEERIEDGFTFDTIGIEEPYDIDEKPRLFDDTQVKKLLSKRTCKTKNSYLEEDEKLFETLDSFGINIPEDSAGFRYPRTELQGDQIWQARKILAVKGNNLNGHEGTCCKHCNSNLVAAIIYDVTGKNYSKLTEDLHAPCKGNALTIDLGNRIFFDNEDSKTANYPAYFCLNCGERFGKLHIPDEIEDLYQKDIKNQKKGKK